MSLYEKSVVGSTMPRTLCTSSQLVSRPSLPLCTPTSHGYTIDPWSTRLLAIRKVLFSDHALTHTLFSCADKIEHLRLWVFGIKPWCLALNNHDTLFQWQAAHSLLCCSWR